MEGLFSGVSTGFEDEILPANGHARPLGQGVESATEIPQAEVICIKQLSSPTIDILPPLGSMKLPVGQHDDLTVFPFSSAFKLTYEMLTTYP